MDELAWRTGEAAAVADHRHVRCQNLDDHASLQLDVGILAAPGVERVEWLDREEFMVGAPTLCVDGMTAVVANVLADPRVRV